MRRLFAVRLVETAIKDDRKAKGGHPPRGRCASNDLDPKDQVGRPTSSKGFPLVADLRNDGVEPSRGRL